MKEVIKLYDNKKIRIFIRNRYTLCFSDRWNLINIQRAYYSRGLEYNFCLLGFDLVLLVRKFNGSKKP